MLLKYPEWNVHVKVKFFLYFFPAVASYMKKSDASYIFFPNDITDTEKEKEIESTINYLYLFLYVVGFYSLFLFSLYLFLYFVGFFSLFSFSFRKKPNHISNQNDKYIRKNEKKM